MAGAPRALAKETCETNDAIARGVTAMVVGSGALLAFFRISPPMDLCAEAWHEGPALHDE
jgi:hypothetical protein